MSENTTDREPTDNAANNAANDPANDAAKDSAKDAADDAFAADAAAVAFINGALAGALAAAKVAPALEYGDAVARFWLTVAQSIGPDRPRLAGRDLGLFVTGAQLHAPRAAEPVFALRIPTLQTGPRTPAPTTAQDRPPATAASNTNDGKDGDESRDDGRDEDEDRRLVAHLLQVAARMVLDGADGADLYLAGQDGPDLPLGQFRLAIR